MVWCAGKVVMGFTADVPSLVLGRDNAMFSGQIDFGTVSSPAQAAQRIREFLSASEVPAAVPANKYLDLCVEISAARRAEDSLEKLADAVLGFAAN